MKDAKEMCRRGIVTKDAVDTTKFDESSKLFFVFFEFSTSHFGAVDEERIGDL